MRKTSGTERCFLPSPLTFELFCQITFMPIRLDVSRGPAREEMSEMGFQLQKLKRCQFSMTFAGANITSVKKVLNPKFPLSCHLCGASVAKGLLTQRP